MQHDTETYTLPCAFIRESEKAVLITDISTGENLWIPLSQIKEMHKDPTGVGRIVMTAWIAKQKDLI